MRRAQWLEALCGILTALLGLAALAYTAIFLRGTSQTNQGGVITTTPGRVEFRPVFVINLSIVALVLLGIGIGAILHSRTGSTVWRVLLMIATAYLLVFTVLGMFSIGTYLLPSVVLALVTVVLSFTARSNPAPG
jgi:hypothetical protein